MWGGNKEVFRYFTTLNVESHFERSLEELNQQVEKWLKEKGMKYW